MHPGIFRLETYVPVRTFHGIVIVAMWSSGLEFGISSREGMLRIPLAVFKWGTRVGIGKSRAFLEVDDILFPIVRNPPQLLVIRGVNTDRFAIHITLPRRIGGHIGAHVDDQCPALRFSHKVLSGLGLMAPYSGGTQN